MSPLPTAGSGVLATQNMRYSDTNHVLYSTGADDEATILYAIVVVLKPLDYVLV